MKRRNFLIGTAGTAIGGSALLGSSAFSRVESHRDVSISVANDADAYLGLKTLDTPNSNNFVAYDENGHIYIDIGDFANAERNSDTTYEYETGTGVNSDSFTWFDGMFEICNQGKADANVSYNLPDGVVQNTVDEQTVTFYYIVRNSDGEVNNRRMIEEGEELLLELGECAEIGVRTVTKGIDATANDTLIDGEVSLTAVAPNAGDTS